MRYLRHNGVIDGDTAGLPRAAFRWRSLAAVHGLAARWLMGTVLAGLALKMLVDKR